MLDRVRSALADEFPKELVDQLLVAYNEMKTAFAQSKFRPSELEGGRFCEVVFRMLEAKTNPNSAYTPLSRPLNSIDSLIERLQSLDSKTFHDSIRVNIPRVLRSIYHIRNRRNVGHVSGDVSPNIADATLVITTASWVLAELIRLYFHCSLTEAQTIVDGLVEQKIPVIEDFNGFLKTLNPSFSLRERLLVLLYHRGESGASRTELGQWLKGRSSGYISSELGKMEKDDLIHRDNGKCYLTRRGGAFVEQRISFEPTLKETAKRSKKVPSRRQK